MQENNHQLEKAMVRGSSATVGFMVGAVVGAGIALLFAPARGSDARRKVGQTVRNIRHGMADGVGKAKDLKDAAQNAVDSGREAFNRARSEASTHEPQRPRP